jgi:hypothetical protein
VCSSDLAKTWPDDLLHDEFDIPCKSRRWSSSRRSDGIDLLPTAGRAARPGLVRQYGRNATATEHPGDSTTPKLVHVQAKFRRQYRSERHQPCTGCARTFSTNSRAARFARCRNRLGRTQAAAGACHSRPHLERDHSCPTTRLTSPRHGLCPGSSRQAAATTSPSTRSSAPSCLIATATVLELTPIGISRVADVAYADAAGPGEWHFCCSSISGVCPSGDRYCSAPAAAGARLAQIRTRTRLRARPSRAGLAARPPGRLPGPLDQR